ncbi:hypothetical protein MKX01_026904 [Papaver californicum]|nr:hypothetical protein MKX01_026904 [Papaver californicum]
MSISLVSSQYPSFLVVVLLFLLCSSIIKSSLADDPRAIYQVLMEGEPVAFRQSDAMPFEEGKTLDPNSMASKAHAKRLVDSHDLLLQSTLKLGTYNKIYSFKHIVNGFAIHTTPSQAKILESTRGVKLVEKNRGAKLMTTYSPQYLELPTGVWNQGGGYRNAGEGIVIGVIDTGINPMHPSFSYDPANPFTLNLSRFSGACESGPRFDVSSCNGKIVSARYFSAGAQAVTPLNSSIDFLSPFDAVGHGSHVTSTAAGNSMVPVIQNGFFYGFASGMAPRARIAVYKAIFPSVGTVADVVSAIDQAIMDGVDILTLSVGPDEPPQDTITFFNVFDIFMLFARHAGVFVVQAAGNQGPSPSTVVSFSPWAVGVAACSTDRSFPGTLNSWRWSKNLGCRINWVCYFRIGPTMGDGLLQYRLVLAKDAVKENGTFPKTPEYVEECQYPEALDPSAVQGSIVICSFSAGFANGTSTVTAISDTARALGFTGFILVANPAYGEFIAEPIPFSVPGIMIPRLVDAKIISDYYEQQIYWDQSGIGRRYSGKAAIGDGRLAHFQGQAPVVSRFSSRGPDIIDNDRNPVDVLKPDILAPGHLVWAAWSPVSIFDQILMALIKQFNPLWTPSMIASSISTTASRFDNRGEPIMAEGAEIARSEDYINFLCSLPNVDPPTVKAMTGKLCNNSFAYPADLNLPSITNSALNGSRFMKRTVKNVATKTETYLCSILQPPGIAVNLTPSWFTINPQRMQDLYIKLDVNEIKDDFSFCSYRKFGSYCYH